MPVLAAMLYTGADPCDVLAITKEKASNGAFDFNRQKTGNPVWKPIPKALAVILDKMDRHDSDTLFANTKGQAWTKSGFDTIWQRLKLALEKDGIIDKGLTLKGLRHTHATLLREQGEDDRTIADALGDKSESMGRHYSRDADIKNKMKAVVVRMDNQKQSVNPPLKTVNPVNAI